MVFRQHKLFWGSSYDRGLDMVLKLWPEIRKAVPDAELHCCYGWNLFNAFFNDNPERMAWMDKMNKLMEMPGITHHGRVGRKELARIRQDCGIWFYPTYFTEINCITALQCQEDGVVPVVTNFAALKETVGSGTKIDGDIYLDEVQDAALKAVAEMMTNKELWEKESIKAQEFAKDYTWLRIAAQWEAVFDEDRVRTTKK
jgi:glycosyltransferase involved in cell wall biosynthesis